MQLTKVVCNNTKNIHVLECAGGGRKLNLTYIIK